MTNLPVEKTMQYNLENGDEMKLTISMVRQFLVQGNADYVTDQEVIYFMHECKARRLNPFLRECWLIKYSANDHAQIVESIHHKRANARKAPDCRGWERGLILQTANGEIKYSRGLVLDGEKLLGAYFRAQPRGWETPYELEINLAGYIKKTRDGRTTKFWAEENQPSMIMKVAESQGLSALWGDAVGNNQIPEEVQETIDITPAPSEPEKPFSIHLWKLIPEKTDPQLLAQFINVTAKANDISITELENSAAKDIDGFMSAFTKWAEKQPDTTPEPEESPLDELYGTLYRGKKGKDGTSYSTNIFKNLEQIKQMTPEQQKELRDKWDRFYEDAPWPLDPKPELPEEQKSNGVKLQVGYFLDTDNMEQGLSGTETMFQIADVCNKSEKALAEFESMVKDVGHKIRTRDEAASVLPVLLEAV